MYIDIIDAAGEPLGVGLLDVAAVILRGRTGQQPVRLWWPPTQELAYIQLGFILSAAPKSKAYNTLHNGMACKVNALLPKDELIIENEHGQVRVVNLRCEREEQG